MSEKFRIEQTEAEQNEVKLMLRRANTIHRALKTEDQKTGYELYPAFVQYTGVNEPLGAGQIHNSVLSAWQMSITLASQNHPLIEELITKQTKESNPENDQRTEEIKDLIHRMVDEKILSELKILDMGCGPKPTYARCVRELGADVYTVDAEVGVHEFQSVPDFSDIHFTVEREQHMQLNLKETNAARMLINAFGGDFDVVTSSHLDTDWLWAHLRIPVAHLYTTIGALIKPEGWYIPLPSFNPNFYSARGNTIKRHCINQ